MIKNLEAAGIAIDNAQKNLREAAKEGIDSGHVGEAQSALAFCKELDEKQKQIAQLVKRANAKPE